MVSLSEFGVGEHFSLKNLGSPGLPSDRKVEVEVEAKTEGDRF